jgi:hypothetical protein
MNNPTTTDRIAATLEQFTAPQPEPWAPPSRADLEKLAVTDAKIHA